MDTLQTIRKTINIVKMNWDFLIYAIIAAVVGWKLLSITQTIWLEYLKNRYADKELDRKLKLRKLEGLEEREDELKEREDELKEREEELKNISRIRREKRYVLEIYKKFTN